MAHDAATAGRDGEESRIARGEERDADADDQSHFGFQFQRAAEESVVGLIHVELHCTAFAAPVDGSLNAGCVELLFVCGSERVAAGLQLRVERGAELGEERLDY